MKKHLKVILLTVLSVIAVEFVGSSVWSAMKKYDRTMQQNRKLRRELHDCQDRLAKYENVSDYKVYDKFSYYCTAKAAE